MGLKDVTTKKMETPKNTVPPSFRIEDCSYKNDFEEIKKRISVYNQAIKNHKNSNSIRILEANVNMLFEHLKTEKP